MIKLPALLKAEDTATKLEKARAAEAATLARIAQLNGERDEALRGDDYAARAAQIRGELEAQRAIADDHRGRVAALERKLAVEQEVYRSNRFEEEKAKAIARAKERTVARNMLVARWLQFLESARAYRRASADIPNKWSRDAPRPPWFGFGFDADIELGELVTMLHPYRLVHPTTRQELGASAFAKRLLSSDERIGDWAAEREAREREDIAHLESAVLPAPEPEPEPEEPEPDSNLDEAAA